MLETLQTDRSSLTSKEQVIIDTLFKKKLTLMENVFEKSKYLAILAILFVVFSLPQADELMKKIYPAFSGSPYLLLAAKTVLFCIVYFAVSQIQFAMK